MKFLHQRGGWALEQPHQGSGCSTELPRVQEVSGQCSQTHGLIFWGLSCVEPGVDMMVLKGLFQHGKLYNSKKMKWVETDFKVVTKQ